MRRDSSAVPRTSTTFAHSWMWRQQWVHRRDLLRELIARDVSLRYRGSVLGMAWTLLNPLAELLVLLFIFGQVLPLNISNYAPFLFTGLLAYNWFQSALMFSTGAVVGNRELIRRPGMPFRVLPIVTVASTLLHFLLSLPILFVLLVFSKIAINQVVLLLPVIIAIEFVVVLSLAYPLAIISVWFRDTQYFLRVALQLLFYLTPVFYEVGTIPERYRTIYMLNPMVHVLEAYRDVLLRGVVPAFTPLAVLTAISGLLLLAGLTIFWFTSHLFVDEI